MPVMLFTPVFWKTSYIPCLRLLLARVETEPLWNLTSTLLLILSVLPYTTLQIILVSYLNALLHQNHTGVLNLMLSVIEKKVLVVTLGS